MLKVEKVTRQIWRVTDSETGQAYRMNRVGDVFVEDGTQPKSLLDDWNREPQPADEATTERVQQAVTDAGYPRHEITAGEFAGQVWWSSRKADKAD